MGSTSGVADQILSLPKGGGAVQGLGEKFGPDLHTGTGSYAVPLDIPNGPNDIAPKLTLLYHTGCGNGPFGMGFSLNLLTISRSTEKRIPTYRGDDPLVLVGGGELVALGGGRYRLRVDTNGWQIEREGHGFRLTDREGKFYRLGVTAQASLAVTEGGREKVLSWHLEEIEDPLGTRVSFAYRRDGNQLYLERVDYGIYTVRLVYEQRPDPLIKRPDPLISGRAGFLITTRLRCTSVELLLNTSSHPLTRRWELAYVQSEPGGHSLLRQVRLTGFDEAGATASLPVLTLGYTTFQPRRLERFTAEVFGAPPGALPGGRRELLDWDGDGLPDLIELSGGGGRVWRNLGDCTWARPQTLPALPTPVALDQPDVAFADMEGNGTADLVLVNRPLAGYYPHRPGGGFDQPVFWRQAPSATLADRDTRLVDLNGDGVTDLLVTGERFFTLYYRDGADGWQERPATIPRPNVPPVALHDPRVHLADMNGDGLQDLVRVDGAGVTYWPYLGDGRWADPVRMENSPVLPPRFEPERLFLADVDGDGCADLVYVDFERVRYWLNQGGTRLSMPREIAHTPPATMAQVRLADMKGTGTGGVLWSYVRPGSRTTDFFYLDFTGGTKPYLLNRIDNGMGRVIEMEYRVSTAEAARDRREGRPWPTFLPFPMPVVASIRTTDRATGRQSISRFRYHNGHFDGIAREVAGFGAVDVVEDGDVATPAMRTVNTFHLGLDPADLARHLPAAERARLRALRGKLLRAEVFGLDGSPDEGRPYQRTENTWTTAVRQVVNGVEIVAPSLMEGRTLSFERQTEPYRIISTRTLAEDAFGNAIDQEERAEDPRDPALTRVLRTTATYAADPAGRFPSKPARVTQRDEAGRIVAVTISYYDGLPEGQAGVAGLLTRQESLVLTDGLVAQVYGVAPPDFAALGYHRRAGEDGWWVDQVRYARTDDAAGLRGAVTNARGHVTQIAFDPHRMQPVRVVDAHGNATTATYDYRANKIETLADPNGAVITNRYDPLGRLVHAVEPGASEALPSGRWTYETDHAPVRLRSEERAVNGQAAVIARKVFLDGTGEVIEERVVTAREEIVERSQLYTARGLVRAQFLPFTAPGPDYAIPAAALPHRALRYDALGRLVEIRNPDGSVRRQEYGPGTVHLFDEEDARIDAGAPHAATPTRHTYDPTGRIREVALDDGGRLIATRYEYDVKGHLIQVVDPGGHETRFVYDALGRRLLTSSPTSGTTRFVLDPHGNQVERRDARGELVRQEFDELDRLTRVSFPATGAGAATHIYHDTGRPAPPEAGAFTRGRLVKVTHQGGEEVYAYDGAGRMTQKRLRPAALAGQELVFDYTYRADGQRDAVTYPEPATGAGHLHVRYEYDERGLLLRIPSFVRRIDHSPAGQRTRVEYANDVVTTYDYDPASLRLSRLRTMDGAGTVLQSFEYHYDLTGNLLRVDSPDADRAASYVYDDLYRLSEASTQSGRHWTFRYDDLGNLTFKSDVGVYQYDAAGLLTSAGPDAFTYTPAGQAATGPMGTLAYDPIGRAASITRGAEQMRCVYDHEGRRVRAEVTGAAALDLLTPDDLLALEDGAVYGFVFDGGVRVAQVRLDTNVAGFLHGDHLGSTTLVTGAGGQVLQRVTYDPFGAIVQNTVTPGADDTRYLYTGQLWDAWAGLVYLSTRYYDPRLGRFLAPDALVPELYLPQAWNRYSYVQNNPLRFVDPTGHFWEEIGDWFKENWQYVVAAVAITAIVALTVLLAGPLAAALSIHVASIFAGVAVGMAIGGLIGGIAADQAGGDVWLGVLTGMALGGAAALAGFGINVGVLALGLKGLTAALVTGTVSGAVSGAAMGFTAGFAGGAGNAGTIWDRIWRGALAGAVVGLVFGGLAYGFQVGWKPLQTRVHWPDPNYLSMSAAGPSGPAVLQPQASTALTALQNSTSNAGQGFLLWSPLFAKDIAPVWQITFTSGLSGAVVLDWADDLWEFLLNKGFVKYDKSGPL